MTTEKKLFIGLFAMSNIKDINGLIRGVNVVNYPISPCNSCRIQPCKFADKFGIFKRLFGNINHNPFSSIYKFFRRQFFNTISCFRRVDKFEFCQRGLCPNTSLWVKNLPFCKFFIADSILKRSFRSLRISSVSISESYFPCGSMVIGSPIFIGVDK